MPISRKVADIEFTRGDAARSIRENLKILQERHKLN